MRRVNELLRESIAEEIARLKDPGLGFVTITGIDTAPDLRSARVYYSVLGDEDQHLETQKALERASGRVRTAVGKKVRLKYLPELRFEIDSAIEEGLKIEALLRRLREEEHREESGGDPSGG
jgi:ribosome-binding factor A